MCGSKDLLIGQSQFVELSLDVANERVAGFEQDLVELVQAKTGLKAAAKSEGNEIRVALVGGPAMGSKPQWCVRSIDRADPRKIFIRSRVVEAAPDRFEVTIEFWLRHEGAH